VQYESERAELGIGASEDEARKARYKFLLQCCNKYNAELVTAHHQDDVLETMLINLIRGTGWRGLAPMNGSNSKQTPNNKLQITNNDQSTNPQTTKQASVIPEKSGVQSIHLSGANHASNSWSILRPILNVSKQEILAYAKRHNVEWREDSTNADTAYLRNYLRHVLLPAMEKKDSNVCKKLIEIYKTQTILKNEIATELQNVVIKYQISNISYLGTTSSCSLALPHSKSSTTSSHVLTQIGIQTPHKLAECFIS
jgi:tRNA(Ile)-lysidine synthase